jgi:hypothetical protein
MSAKNRISSIEDCPDTYEESSEVDSAFAAPRSKVDLRFCFFLTSAISFWRIPSLVVQRIVRRNILGFTYNQLPSILAKKTLFCASYLHLRLW